MLAERSAVDDGGDQLAVIARDHIELDLAVVDQQGIARLGRFDEWGVRSEDPPGDAGAIADREAQRLTLLKYQRRAAFERASADFWPAQILHDRHMTAGRGGGPANRGEDGAMRIVRAMGEIQAEDVDPCGDQAIDRRRRAARWADRGDDLGAAHPSHANGSTSALGMRIASASASASFSALRP